MRAFRVWLGGAGLWVACGSTLPSFEALDDTGEPDARRVDAGVVLPDAAPLPGDATPPWRPPYDAGPPPSVLPSDAGAWTLDGGLGPPLLPPWDIPADAGLPSACRVRPTCLSAGWVRGAGSTLLGPLTFMGATVSYLSGFSNSTLLTLFASTGGTTTAFELELVSPSKSPVVPAGEYAVNAWSYGAVPGNACFSLESTGIVRVERHEASALPTDGEPVTFAGSFVLDGQLRASGSFELGTACGSALSFE